MISGSNVIKWKKLKKRLDRTVQKSRIVYKLRTNLVSMNLDGERRWKKSISTPGQDGMGKTYVVQNAKMLARFTISHGVQSFVIIATQKLRKKNGRLHEKNYPTPSWDWWFAFRISGGSAKESGIQNIQKLMGHSGDPWENWTRH